MGKILSKNTLLISNHNLGRMEKMHNDSRIYFKIELIKHNKTLNVNIHLNPQEQNVTVDEHTISWSPTKEEQQFLFESLQLIKQQEINERLIFNKKQNTDLRIDYKKDQNHTTENSDTESELLCNKSTNEDQWESIDRVINNKLNM